MGFNELEKKLAQLSMESEKKDNVFGKNSVKSFEVVEESPFKLDMEIAGGSRPRTR